MAERIMQMGCGEQVTSMTSLLAPGLLTSRAARTFRSILGPWQIDADSQTSLVWFCAAWGSSVLQP